MTDHYERVMASAPVNSQAAKQLGKGVDWTPEVALQDWHENCPPLQALDRGTFNNPEFIDFTGEEFGRLRVIGLMKKGDDGKTSRNPSSWVCRCKCGGYCTRKSKSLRRAAAGNSNSFVDRCGRCEYQRALRSGWTPSIKKEWRP